MSYFLIVFSNQGRGYYLNIKMWQRLEWGITMLRKIYIWFITTLPRLLFSLRLSRQSWSGQERKCTGTLFAHFSTVSRVNCHPRTSHFPLLLTQHSLLAGSAEGFQKAQDWGLGQSEAQTMWITVHKYRLPDSKKWTSGHSPHPF